MGLAILPRIERYLRENRMLETRFGRLAANDPNLVTSLRRGREPRADLIARIERQLTEK